MKKTRSIVCAFNWHPDLERSPDRVTGVRRDSNKKNAPEIALRGVHVPANRNAICYALRIDAHDGRVGQARNAAIGNRTQVLLPGVRPEKVRLIVPRGAGHGAAGALTAMLPAAVLPSSQVWSLNGLEPDHAPTLHDNRICRGRRVERG